MYTFKCFFSFDSSKAVKAEKFGYLNAINYMAPASTAGVGNLCPHASPGCLKLCLGWFSGQAGIVKDQSKDMNHVRKFRVAKAKLFMDDRKAFMDEMGNGIRLAKRTAARKGLKLCVRLNGATDIAWERVAPSLFSWNYDLQFVDYTKSKTRALAHARGDFPKNYHLTFSRSETNEADCVEVLKAGGNVAVVFAGEFPVTYLGARVINGDTSDLRHLDADRRGTGLLGVIVGLTPKGNRAKHDQSGFVVH